uniref:Uncharacterized protein n=1 Tax=Cucumis sativus TaxID=3659 RepID=A0A0A0L7L7_CUCSA
MVDISSFTSEQACQRATGNPFSQARSLVCSNLMLLIPSRGRYQVPVFPSQQHSSILFVKRVMIRIILEQTPNDRVDVRAQWGLAEPCHCQPRFPLAKELMALFSIPPLTSDDVNNIFGQTMLLNIDALLVVPW